VTLLVDQNLSHRLCWSLADIFPNARHVRDVGLGTATDTDVWTYAASHNLIIISKDADFHQRALRFGLPPKVIWLRLGNGPTSEIERVLRQHHAAISRFAEDVNQSLLILGSST
jgi:predicted nuclease of predicted toxin-antitoxin system